MVKFTFKFLFFILITSGGLLTFTLGYGDQTLDEEIQEFLKETDHKNQQQVIARISQKISSVTPSSYHPTPLFYSDLRRILGLSHATIADFFNSPRTRIFINNDKSSNIEPILIPFFLGAVGAEKIQDGKDAFYHFVASGKELSDMDMNRLIDLNPEYYSRNYYSLKIREDLDILDVLKIQKGDLLIQLFHEGKINIYNEPIKTYIHERFGVTPQELEDFFNKIKDKSMDGVDNLDDIVEEYKEWEKEKEKTKSKERTCAEPKSQIEDLTQGLKEISAKLKDPHLKGDFKQKKYKDGREVFERDGKVDEKDLTMLKNGLFLAKEMKKLKDKYDELSKKSENEDRDITNAVYATLNGSPTESSSEKAEPSIPEQMDSLLDKSRELWKEKVSEAAFADFDHNGKFDDQDIGVLEKWIKEGTKIEGYGEEYVVLMDEGRKPLFNPVEWPWRGILEGSDIKRHKENFRKKIPINEPQVKFLPKKEKDF